jgi:hypothetical protein
MCDIGDVVYFPNLTSAHLLCSFSKKYLNLKVKPFLRYAFKFDCFSS